MRLNDAPGRRCGRRCYGRGVPGWVEPDSRLDAGSACVQAKADGARRGGTSGSCVQGDPGRGHAHQITAVNQLDYLTTKSTHIVDSSGFLDGKSKLDRGEIKDLTERFAKRWDAGFKPKLGQTTHLLMSFPIGTRGEDVRDIATDVAERFFQTDEGHFDYIIAVHEDRDHPHAHLVLNRRSQEGEFFYLARNHRFNYDDFRLAMVEEAETYGVRLEATRRVDRGEVHYPAKHPRGLCRQRRGQDASGARTGG